MRRVREVALAAVLPLLFTACAGSTMGTGVSPKLLRRPPYYAGQMAAPGLSVVHLPIAAGATSGDEDAVRAAAGTPAAQLLAAMNAYLDSLGVSSALVARAAQPSQGPDVSFACEADAFGDCAEAESNQGNMMLQVTRPSDGWKQWLGSELVAVPADALLLITLELADYWPHTRGLRAHKEVELGTGYTQDLPWLTAMDRPVQVLQLTGALLGADGRALRIGAEGLFAKRTRLLPGAFGIREMVSDEDIARLSSLRRADLPGEPLVWQAALRSLVRELTGRP